MGCEQSTANNVVEREPVSLADVETRLYDHKPDPNRSPVPTVKKTVTLIAPLDKGEPGPEHFKIVDGQVPSCQSPGDIVVQVLAMSADPYLRGRIRPGGGMEAGDNMSGFTAGVVIESMADDWVLGDLYGASTDFSNILLLSADARKATLMWKLTGLVEEKNISYGVGALGMPGSTAYGGLIDVLKPEKGNVIFVSAAAGAVGGLVGQIAKNEYGCTVIGSCGGPVKGKIILDEYGYDHHIDYKQVRDKEALAKQIKECSPDGIDMYFENVGGMHFEAAMATLKPKGRIAVCGSISNYNKGAKDADYNMNKINISQMIYTFQRVEGFVCMPWLSGARGNFLQDMSRWVKEGKIVIKETHHNGIEEWPNAFKSLFTGTNKGKVVVLL